MTARVDLAELAEAFEDASPALDYFVDRETGEVMLVSDTLGFIEAGHQRAAMARFPGRYPRVPVSGVDEFTEDIESFIEGLEDEALQEELEEVLDAADPRTSFARRLAKRDGIATRWLAHRGARFRQRAKRWLAAQGLEPA